MMMCHPTKFGCKKISSSVDMLETVISDYISPHCDLELEDSKSSFFLFFFCMTPGSMMVHHYTKFCNEKLTSLGDSVEMNIH